MKQKKLPLKQRINKALTKCGEQLTKEIKENPKKALWDFLKGMTTWFLLYSIVFTLANGITYCEITDQYNNTLLETNQKEAKEIYKQEIKQAIELNYENPQLTNNYKCKYDLKRGSQIWINNLKNKLTT